MNVAQEIREEQKQALSSMTKKEKLKYFWDYYKIHTIVGILVVILAVAFIRDMASNKPYNFYAVMLNSYYLNGEEFAEAFAEYAGLDTENYDSYIDANSTLSLSTPSQYDLATSQKIMAVVQTRELDVLVGDQVVFNNYASNGLYMDLREILTNEQMEMYKDSFFWVDRAELEKEDDTTEYLNSDYPSAEELELEAETHKSSSGMADPIPVGIYVTDSPFMTETLCYLGMDAVFGVTTNCTRPETALTFLEYLYSGEVPEFTQTLY